MELERFFDSEAAGAADSGSEAEGGAGGSGKNAQGQKWVFTLFCASEEEARSVLADLPRLEKHHKAYKAKFKNAKAELERGIAGEYGGAQIEVCPTTGRWHIQGFMGWRRNWRWKRVKETVHPTMFFELMGGNLEQNKAYCSKTETSQSEYKAWGDWPVMGRGKRSDLDSAVKTLHSTVGTVRDKLKAVAVEHGTAFVKYHKGFKVLAEVTEVVEAPPKPLWRAWQMALELELEQEPDDRHIIWYNDPKGGQGKSKFTSYYTATPECKAIVLSGKLADMRYAFKEQKSRIVFFDIARAEKDYVEHMYTMAEELKNGRYMNTKYESCLVLFKPPHVVFFTNMAPDYSKWSADRLIYREFLEDGSLPPVFGQGAGFHAASLPIPGDAPGFSQASVPLSLLDH